MRFDGKNRLFRKLRRVDRCGGAAPAVLSRIKQQGSRTIWCGTPCLWAEKVVTVQRTARVLRSRRRRLDRGWKGKSTF